MSNENNIFQLSYYNKKIKKSCQHKQFEVCMETETVSCRGCGEQLGLFKVIKQLAIGEIEYNRKLETAKAEIDELKAFAPHLKATKNLERIWRGKSNPCCPSCKNPIHAESMIGRILTRPKVTKRNGNVTTIFE